jgi:uncharacterized membrane protein
VIAANAFYIVFRLFHILSGVLWVGSAFLFVGFIGPSAAEVGPSAGPLLHAVVKKRKVVTVITVLSSFTVVAGWILWLKDMSARASLADWVKSPLGLGLTIGGILATIAWGIGYFGIGKNVERLVDLSDEIGAAGGPPSAEQQTAIQHLGGELERHGKLDLVILVLAVACMATARYW